MKGSLSRSSALSVEIDVGGGNLSVLCTSYQWFAPVAVDVHAVSRPWQHVARALGGIYTVAQDNLTSASLV
jgi:hypothetical protein